MSPRGTRTQDAWRTRRAPDEPARHPRGTRGAPGGHPVSLRCTRTRDAWCSWKVPGGLVLLARAERAVLPEGFSARSKGNASRLSCS